MAEGGVTMSTFPSLADFLEHEVYPRLAPEDIYIDPAHQWKHQSPRKWQGGCPWHQSKSGTSFVVSRDSLLWWCQGCGIGGTPLQYLWKRRGGAEITPRGADFVAMVQELAVLAGVAFPARTLTREEQVRARQWETRRAELEAVTAYAQQVLWSQAGEAARGYLHTRGFSENAIRALGMGLYPTVDEVVRLLQTQGHDLQDARQHGLLWQKLAGYVVIPWADEYGRPLTLYGRWPSKTLPADRPKTIALPGDDSKRSPLYFDRTRQAGHAEVVLVEGVLDAALLQALGDTRVIACVSAQLSRLQVHTLVRHKVRAVTTCLDPDQGGERGVVSCIKSLKAAGIRAYVAPTLPAGLDPDEFVLRDGLDAWHAHVARAQAAVLWQVDRALQQADLTTASGRDTALGAVRYLVRFCTDARERYDAWCLVAERTGYPVAILQQTARGVPLSDPWLGDRRQWHGVPLAVRRVVP
jgi:DNA primase catalytic core